ncbi:GNAT family N-acetyltransferase [Streptomyces sp. NPDC088729]|uniref:GNAT family N-acetyltransferase n=1 Tax=Streptomyces sp. NPDC088729 TaxID=3365876 RepID=UPI00380D6537
MADLLDAVSIEKHPLHPVLRTAYLLVTDRSGRARAALPAYLQRDVDPMRVIADHHPRAAGRTVLLSHVWHCYDTVLPARPGPGAASAARHALAGLRDLASSWEAQMYGMVNVDAAGPLDALLTEAGLSGTDIDVGWGFPLDRYGEFDDYLRHDLRAADRAGITIRTSDARGADLHTFVALARSTAAKYDNADCHQPGLFEEFVLALGDCARSVEVRVGDRTVASALALTDDTRFHYWALGYVDEDTPGYSPFYVAYAQAMKEAWASGRPWAELGRRNPTFQRRYGRSAVLRDDDQQRGGSVDSATGQARRLHF